MLQDHVANSSAGPNYFGNDNLVPIAFDPGLPWAFAHHSFAVILINSKTSSFPAKTCSEI
jgi:hypothetical protein